MCQQQGRRGLHLLRPHWASAPVYAERQRENFIGSYDNTDIFFKLMDAMGLSPDA